MKTWLLIITMQALFALTFPVGKLALAYADALFLVGLRMTLAGILLLSYCRATNAWRPVLRRDWFLVLRMALFAVYLSFVPEFWALKTLSSIKTNLLWSSLPFVSAILSYYLLHERLSKNQWLGLAVGVFGMAPVIMMPADESIASFSSIAWPDLMMVVAVFSCAYGWFLMKELLNRGYAIIFVNGITMFLGGLLCFITHYLQDIFVIAHTQAYTEFWPMLGYTLILILISNVIGYNLYGYLMRSCSLTFLSFTGFLCPLFGALFSKLILHEEIRYQYVVAFICVIIGLWIFYYDELHNNKKMVSCKTL